MNRYGFAAERRLADDAFMPSRSRFDRRVLPADLIAAAVRLNQDEQRPRSELNQRAHRVRKTLNDMNSPPVTEWGRVLFWLNELPDVESEHANQQVRSAFALIGLIITLLGLLSGIGLSLGVYYYDGSQPVNVVAGLGVFVLLQSLLLVLAVIAALPRGWMMRVPLAEGVQEALRLASPGRLGLLASRLLPQEMREGLATAIGRAGRHQRVFARVQLWTILQWSQLYAVVLNLAALGTFVYLVLFTDLAFGWATTLKIQPAEFHTFVHSLALPWWWLSDAVPSLELVERSRFYRGTPFAPEQRGGWWPFLLMAMAIYGVLPRIIALVIAHRQLSLATRRALLVMPGMSAVLRELDHALTSDTPTDETNTPRTETPSPVSIGESSVVIDWSRAAGSVARASQLLGKPIERMYPAGGSRTLAEDDAQLKEMSEAVSNDRSSAGVVVLVKLWEPPVIEVTEYFKQLREAAGEAVDIVIVPVASELGGAVVSDDPDLAVQWRRRIDAVGDPWLRLGETVGLRSQGGEDE